MSARMLRALAQNSQLRDQFRTDPHGAIEHMQEALNLDLSRLTHDDIKMIQHLTDEEFEMFVGIAERMQELNVKNFKM